MKVLVIGGSRNIGYITARRLLQNSATVTFLLRNTSCFDGDDSIKPFVASGKARLVQGDALKQEDVRRAWDAASQGDDGPLDTIIFTVGGTPSFSVTKGFVLTPPDICSRCMLNLLSVYPHDPTSQPNLVVISSTGLGKTAHKALPVLLKPVYAYLISAPHTDKLGMERAIWHAAGWEWPALDGEPDKEILPDGWQERVGSSGWLKHVVIIRPALLTDGACKGDESSHSDKAAYRAEDREICGSYTISRKDVAHFIATGVLPQWQKWEGKCVRIAY